MLARLMPILYNIENLPGRSMRKKTTNGLHVLLNILGVITLAGCNTDTTNSSQTETVTASTTAISASDPVRGASLFSTNCASCHGQGGMGSDHGPPLINRIYEPSHHSDFSFYHAVSKGSRQHHWQFGDMPPVPGLGIQDTADIIAYVRQQQRRAGIE